MIVFEMRSSTVTPFLKSSVTFSASSLRDYIRRASDDNASISAEILQRSESTQILFHEEGLADVNTV